MKIGFDDDSYIVVARNGDKINIIIGAKDSHNALVTIVNSAELTQEQFSKLVESVNDQSN